MSLLFPRSAAAIDVDEVVWGYDGRVVRNHFNLLSLLVSNPTPNAFDGTLLLRKQAGGQRLIGATLANRVFVSPYSSKWVQFEPYLIDDRDLWLLSVKEDADWTFTLPQFRFGPPARVLLANPSDPVPPRVKLRQFSEQLFPTSVTATDGLGSLLIHRAPRWEQARRTAFLDWLYRGGHVHLFHGEQHDFPQFPASLSELNSPETRQHVGNGVIYRHPRTLAEIDDRFINTLETLDGSAATGPGDDSLFVTLNASGATSLESFAADDFRFFATLRSLSRGNRNWAVIYTLSVVYLLLLFPGCYLLGRSRADYRASYAALFVVSTLFSAILLFVGRSGADELSAVRSVAIARPLPNRQWDVWQWSDAFAVDGGWYELVHDGSGRIYSTCEPFQAVKGTIDCGSDARMRVDIPPNSSRSFAHRAKLEGTGLGLQLVDLVTVGSQLQEITLSVDGRIPEPEQVDKLVALYRGRLYRLEMRESGMLQLAPATAAMGRLLNNEWINPLEPYDQSEIGEEDKDERELRRLLYPLMLRSLTLHQTADRETVTLPADRVFVLIYAAMTPEFFIPGDRFRKQLGSVLYVFSFPAPAGN